MGNIYFFMYAAIKDCVLQVLQLAGVIIPISILVEIFNKFGIIDKISLKTEKITKLLSLPKEAAIPCFAGVFLGILSGSGIILSTIKEKRLKKHDVETIFILVGICHSIIEENIIFIGSGGNVLIIALVRFFAGVLSAYVWQLIFIKKHSLLLVKK